MLKFKSSVAAIAILAAPASAYAMVGNDHAAAHDKFFKCASISNIWHAIATGNWVFYC